MMQKLIIEVCPREPRASICLADGRECRDDETVYRDLMDCTGSGDAEPACRYILENYDVDFRIVKRNAAGDYENVPASPEEMQATCRAIYSDSDRDFSEDDWAAIYLVWEAACSEESNYDD